MKRVSSSLTFITLLLITWPVRLEAGNSKSQIPNSEPDLEREEPTI